MFRLLRKMYRRGELDCDDVRNASSDYLDNDLSPRRLAAIQAHLGQCGPCQAFVDALSATIGMLGRLPRVTPPASFKQSVIERIRQEPRP